MSMDRPWRGGGMGPMMPGGVPWAAVRDWCEFHDYPGDAVLFLDSCVRDMDAVFLEWHLAQLPKGKG